MQPVKSRAYPYLGLSGKEVGEPPKYATAYNGIKSEANNNLGYFFVPKRIVPRCRSPPVI